MSLPHSLFPIYSKIILIVAIDLSLVEKYDVRQPDVLGGHVEHVHAPVVLGIPAQFVVEPFLKKVRIIIARD
jgi:hypothetical protein